MIDVDAVRRLERVARALRYRATGICILPADLDLLTDDELAAALLTETTAVVASTLEA